jgi:hypothetical protein
MFRRKTQRVGFTKKNACLRRKPVKNPYLPAKNPYFLSVIHIPAWSDIKVRYTIFLVAFKNIEFHNLNG